MHSSSSLPLIFLPLMSTFVDRVSSTVLLFPLSLFLICGRLSHSKSYISSIFARVCSSFSQCSALIYSIREGPPPLLSNVSVLFIPPSVLLLWNFLNLGGRPRCYLLSVISPAPVATFSPLPPLTSRKFTAYLPLCLHPYPLPLTCLPLLCCCTVFL